jgi:dsDNA-specific endonuclease/ATPase MutS2
LGVAELRQFRQLTEENARFKRVVADLTLDKQILQEVIKEKDLKPALRREIAHSIYERYQMSTRRSCALAKITRAARYHRSRAKGSIGAAAAHSRARPGAASIWL